MWTRDGRTARGSSEETLEAASAAALAARATSAYGRRIGAACRGRDARRSARPLRSRWWFLRSPIPRVQRRLPSRANTVLALSPHPRWPCSDGQVPPLDARTHAPLQLSRYLVEGHLTGSARGVIEATRAGAGLERSTGDVALAWVRDYPGVTSALVGPRTCAAGNPLNTRSRWAWAHSRALRGGSVRYRCA